MPPGCSWCSPGDGIPDPSTTFRREAVVTVNIHRPSSSTASYAAPPGRHPRNWGWVVAQASAQLVPGNPAEWLSSIRIGDLLVAVTALKSGSASPGASSRPCRLVHQLHHRHRGDHFAHRSDPELGRRRWPFFRQAFDP